MDNASKMLVAFLPQDPTSGTAQPSLVDPQYASCKFGTSNLIDLGLKITNVNLGGVTIETEEDAASVTDEARGTTVQSGKVKAGEASFSLQENFDLASLVATLNAIDGVDDPFLGLLVVGKRDGTAATTTSKTFDVYYACAAVLTADPGAQAEAFGKFTSELKFQPSGLPIKGKTACNKKATLTIATNSVAFTTPSNPS